MHTPCTRTPSGGIGAGRPCTITSADTATTDQFLYGDGHWDASFTPTQLIFSFNNAVTYSTGTGAYTTGAISIYDGPLVTYNVAALLNQGSCEKGQRSLFARLGQPTLTNGLNVRGTQACL